MEVQAVELKNKVHLSPDKILNPGNVSRCEGITPDTPVLIVLAAGKGTRFGTNPKCIQPVCGVPLAQHTINAFRRMSDAPAICLVGYKHEEIQQSLGEENIYILSDNPVGGTAYAAWEALSFEELVETNASRTRYIFHKKAYFLGE